MAVHPIFKPLCVDMNLLFSTRNLFFFFLISIMHFILPWRVGCLPALPNISYLRAEIKLYVITPPPNHSGRNNTPFFGAEISILKPIKSSPTISPSSAPHTKILDFVSIGLPRYIDLNKQYADSVHFCVN